MAIDFKNINENNNKSRLPDPPTADESWEKLPGSDTISKTENKVTKKANHKNTTIKSKPVTKHPIKVDGRSLRATGMTEQFNTRTLVGFRITMKYLASREDITIGQLLENMKNEWIKKRDIELPESLLEKVQYEIKQKEEI